MTKICIPLTSRGNYAKMRQFILKLQELKDIDPIVVIGGALLKDGSESVIKYLNDNGITVSYTVDYLSDRFDLYGMVDSSAKALEEFGKLFSVIQPDYVVIIADRYECLPMAIAAAYQNIKICHVEGERLRAQLTSQLDMLLPKCLTYISWLTMMRLKE